MNWIEVQSGRAQEPGAAPVALPVDGYVWLDASLDEVVADPEQLPAAVERLTGVRIFDLHLQDATNPQHPSFFDSTNDYQMLVFRKLSTGEAPPLEEKRGTAADQRRLLQEIVTRPITFFLLDRMLVTVRHTQSKSIDTIRQRMLDPRRVSSDNGAYDRSRLPQRPGELMLRMLNVMVDRYLELREPLSDRLDRWQRDLLDPRRPFSNWTALLEARMELRKLENLSEGQYDALTEMRDEYLEQTPEASVSDAYLVRLNDVMEHIQRVLHHSRRLESSVESAVQLHFSANTHQTNEIVRKLTAIAAIFAPLTLISGIFGMNFRHMPLLDEIDGFWVTVGTMATVAVIMLLYFWTRRILERPRAPRTPRWLR
ncbi:MAG TPA: magnesium transporter CorA family protein [Burkholderiaceae bacterium]|nr:magnesium transporter CorA family protein [Burkholderiaceae bacterium]